MPNIIPLEGGAQLPAYLKDKEALAAINQDVLAFGPSFPVLSTKGKRFTMVKNGERKLLTLTVNGEEIPAPFVTLTVVRANVKSRIFYAKAYEEGESDGVRPTCYSHDGVAPSPNSVEPQAKKCAVCPHAVWGSRTPKPGDSEGGKGTACTVNTRLAVIDPNNSDTPFLLRVPAGSKKNYTEVVKTAENRSIPYNALVLKVGFDAEAQHQLTFKITGLLSDELYARVSQLYESDEIKEIVGLLEQAQAKQDPPALEGPKATEADLEAALAAKAATTKAAETAKAKPAPAATAAELDAAVKKPAPAKETKPAAAKPPVASEALGAMLSDLDALLGMKDD